MLGRLKVLSHGIAVIAASSVLCFSAKAATVSPNYNATPRVITNSTPTHAVFLKCNAGKNLVNQSKGAILALPPDLAKAGKDIAIVSGHGLEQSTDCYVGDFLGNSKKVLSVTFARDYKAGTDTDWALISFKKIKGRHIQRYDVDSVLPDLTALNDRAVTFAQARGLPENTQKCRLADSVHKSLSDKGTIISHDCRAIGGQSGSPITQVINGRHKLIGFHIGSGWTIKSPMTGKPGHVNFMRSYDAQMSSEVKQALREME